MYILTNSVQLGKTVSIYIFKNSTLFLLCFDAKVLL